MRSQSWPSLLRLLHSGTYIRPVAVSAAAMFGKADLLELYLKAGAMGNLDFALFGASEYPGPVRAMEGAECVSSLPQLRPLDLSSNKLLAEPLSDFS